MVMILLGGASVKVQELMSSPAISVKANASLTEIVHLINSHGINHVPVIDDSNRVMGMIGQYELFPKARKFRSLAVGIPVLFRQIVDVKDIVGSYKQAAHVKAKDIMSPAPVCVDVIDEIDHVIWKMVENNLQTVPVLREERLVGIVTRSDFIRLLAREL
jgi:CBS domain-containing protein